MFGPELVEAFRQIQSVVGPGLEDESGEDRACRTSWMPTCGSGAGYHPWQPDTHFKFPADDGSLAKATLRCVGVGKCRQYDGGVMCPSFRVTREEKHSTRGRAHLLWEMTKGAWSKVNGRTRR